MVTQARANLAGAARLHKVVFDRGFLDGADLRWLDQHGITFVVPAKDNMAVTVDAQAQAAAGEEIAVGRRVHSVRHGQGREAWTERLENVVVGITGLTTYDQYGTPALEPSTHPRPPLHWRLSTCLHRLRGRQEVPMTGQQAGSWSRRAFLRGTEERRRSRQAS